MSSRISRIIGRTTFEWRRWRARHAPKSPAKIAKNERKWAARRAIRLPDRSDVLNALASRPVPADPDDLAGYALRVLSQRGEDGMAHEILRRTGFRLRRSVEIGCGSNGGNSGLLAACFDYDALMIDGDPKRMEILEALFVDRRVTAVRAWVTAENVNDLIRANGFGGEVDYLGIDLDGVDYWIWNTITACDPTVVIAEYNPYFGPIAAVTIPYDASFNRHEPRTEGYWGASLQALAVLGQRRGYRLVATSPEWTHNAFFLKTAECPELRTLTAEQAWRPRLKRRETQVHDEIMRVGVIEYFDAAGYPLTSIT